MNLRSDVVPLSFSIVFIDISNPHSNVSRYLDTRNHGTDTTADAAAPYSGLNHRPTSSSSFDLTIHTPPAPHPVCSHSQTCLPLRHHLHLHHRPPIITQIPHQKPIHNLLSFVRVGVPPLSSLSIRPMTVTAR